MSRKTISIAWIWIVLGTLAGAGEHHDHAVVAGPGDARFEFLKRLAGTWQAEEGMDGQLAAQWEFRVTAGGSAVEEREFVGTPMEMVTLYYMDGGDLRATHYCALGNRPQAVATRGSGDAALEFGCTGTPGGAASHDEEHVHGWKFRLDADGRLHMNASIVKAGESGSAPALVLDRTDG